MACKRRVRRRAARWRASRELRAPVAARRVPSQQAFVHMKVISKYRPSLAPGPPPISKPHTPSHRHGSHSAAPPRAPPSVPRASGLASDIGPTGRPRRRASTARAHAVHVGPHVRAPRRRARDCGVVYHIWGGSIKMYPARILMHLEVFSSLLSGYAYCLTTVADLSRVLLTGYTLSDLHCGNGHDSSRYVT